MSFTVQSTPYGVLVFGPIPISAFATVIEQWKGMVLVPGVAAATGATLALTTDANRWLKAVNDELDVAFRDDPQARWLYGTDTGLSSLTLFSVLCDDRLHDQAIARLKGEAHTPRDEDDLNRCQKLLNLFPQWVSRLDDVVDKYPEWGAAVSALILRSKVE